MTYRRIIDSSSSKNNESASTTRFSSNGPSSYGSALKHSAVDDQDELADDDMKQFTRVQVLVPAATLPQSRKCRRLIPASKCLEASLTSDYATEGIDQSALAESEASRGLAAEATPPKSFIGYDKATLDRIEAGLNGKVDPRTAATVMTDLHDYTASVADQGYPAVTTSIYSQTLGGAYAGPNYE